MFASRSVRPAVIKDDADARPTPLSAVTRRGDEEPTTEYVGYRWSGDRMRFLEQATFGPTAALDNRSGA